MHINAITSELCCFFLKLGAAISYTSYIQNFFFLFSICHKTYRTQSSDTPFSSKLVSIFKLSLFLDFLLPSQ